MKTIKSFAMIIGMIMAWFNAIGQWEFQPSQPPLVPVGIYAQGNQAVQSYLLYKIDHVSIKYTGKSLGKEIGPINYDNEFLKFSGYKTPGSFSQFSQVFEAIKFSAVVVPTPSNYEGNDWYDLRAEIRVYSSDDELIMQGNGWTDIKDGKGGLIADTFETWVYLPSTIRVGFGHETVTEARVVGWSEDRDLTVYSDGNQAYVELESQLLGAERNLLLYDGTELSSWNLSTGKLYTGQEVFNVLSAIKGSDVVPLKDNLNHGRSFYKNNWAIYQDFPLINLVLTKKMEIGPNIISVLVWPSKESLSPFQVIATEIKTGKKLILDNGETETLPPGEYHIRTIWGSDIQAPIDDPNPGKG